MIGDPELSRLDLAESLLQLGLHRGDTVLIHAAYSTLEPVEGGPLGVLDTLLDVIGPDGTLIVPTFTLDFCQTGLFDLSAPSPLGIITEMARTDPRFTRTLHPIYSFAIAGRLRGASAAVCSFTAAGADSLFAWLAPLDAIQLLLGVPWSATTYFHHAEEVCGAPYRFAKMFSGRRVRGAEEHLPADAYCRFPGAWSLYVRDWDTGVIACLDQMGEVLEDTPALVRHAWPRRECHCRGVRMRDMLMAVTEVIAAGRAEGLLYRIGTPEEARRA